MKARHVPCNFTHLSARASGSEWACQCIAATGLVCINTYDLAKLKLVQAHLSFCPPAPCTYAERDDLGPPVAPAGAPDVLGREPERALCWCAGRVSSWRMLALETTDLCNVIPLTVGRVDAHGRVVAPAADAGLRPKPLLDHRLAHRHEAQGVRAEPPGEPDRSVLRGGGDGVAWWWKDGWGKRKMG